MFVRYDAALLLRDINLNAGQMKMIDTDVFYRDRQHYDFAVLFLSLYIFVGSDCQSMGGRGQKIFVFLFKESYFAHKYFYLSVRLKEWMGTYFGVSAD